MKETEILKRLEAELINSGTSKEDIEKIKNNICLNCNYENKYKEVICSNCKKLVTERTDR